MVRYLNSIINCIGGNFIGYPTCDQEDPASGLKLHYIPGINQVLAAKVVSADDTTANALFQKVYREGLNKFIRDFFREVAKRGWQLRTDLDSQIIGGFHKDDTITGVEGTERGVKVTRCDSLYSFNIIEFIRIYSLTEGTHTIVIEINDGGIISQPEFEVSKGPNLLRLDYIAITDEVTITSDLAYTVGEEEEAETFYLEIKDTTNCGCDHTGECGCNDCYCQSLNCQFEVTGIENNGSGFTDSDTLNGFITSVSCIADAAYIVCKYKYELADAMRHAMAIQFFHELLQSRRGNPYASDASKDMAREQLTIINGGTNESGDKIEGEYWKILSDSVDIIESQMEQFGIFECTKGRLVTSLPG